MNFLGNQAFKSALSTKSADGLLPALGFLGELYNFCNFVIIFSLM